MLLLFALLFHASMFRSAHGAFCSSQTGRACVDTLFTTNTCTSNACICKEGFPIPTGCSKKLDKPTVTLVDSARANIVDIDVNVTIVCSTSVTEDSGISFQWRRNSELLNASKPEYTVYVSTVNDTGLYSCQLKYGNYNASDESDSLNMTLLSSDSRLNLTVSGVPPAAALGSTYNVTCNGLPVGVTPTFKINGVEKTNPMAVEDVGNVTCVFRNSSSDPVMTPSVVSDISEVTILVQGSVGTEYIYKTGTNVTLVCMSKPGEDFMNVGSATVKYGIVRDAQPFPILLTIGQTYMLDGSTNVTVYCSASYNFGNSKDSMRITITFTDFHTPAPVLSADGTQLIEGSRVVLRCGNPQTPVYTWIKNAVDILFQHDSIIQFDNFQDTDTGVYSCSIKKNNYIAESKTVPLVLATRLSQPVIRISDKETNFYEGESYGLECQTASATTGMVYVWKKNNDIVAGVAQKLYSLGSVTSKTSGNYTCQAKFKYETADSALVVISVAPALPGKRCTPGTASKDCDGKEYTQECIKDKVYRCKCKTGYEQKGTVCQKSNVIVSSAILVIAGVMLSRLI